MTDTHAAAAALTCATSSLRRMIAAHGIMDPVISNQIAVVTDRAVELGRLRGEQAAKVNSPTWLEELRAAITVVRDDTRESYPDMSAGEAVAHARLTVHPESLEVGTVGTSPLTDAYLLVLNADQVEINEALATR